MRTVLLAMLLGVYYTGNGVLADGWRLATFGLDPRPAGEPGPELVTASDPHQQSASSPPPLSGFDRITSALDPDRADRRARLPQQEADRHPPPGTMTKDWIPRELRQSFVSLLSDSGMPIEAISRLVGHRNTTVTETVYRQQLRPVQLEGAKAMDALFPDD
ncbi:hypothetical protein [Nonomuraea antri]|uniref:hypothetical protein n=1 Tax=Nonomuraea antri TaxID=2730852 RepID=UPI001F2517EA|nr:hypothetical protein [Nonomuraea antri]